MHVDAMKVTRHSAFSYRPADTASGLPPPPPLRQTQNVVIFLGCLFRHTEAIAKRSGGNKWQANAETGRVGEETQSISAQKRYRIFFLYGLILQAWLYFRTPQPKGTGKYHIRRSGIRCGSYVKKRGGGGATKHIP